MADGMKYCRKCGTQVSKDTGFCPNCGSKFVTETGIPVEMGKAKKYCLNCGKELSASAKFCRYCGTQLVAEQTKVRPAGQTKKEPVRQVARPKKNEQTERKPAAPTSRRINADAGMLTGKRILAIVLAIAVFAVTAFKYPGFLVRDKKPGAVSQSLVTGTQSPGSANPGGPQEGPGAGSFGDAAPVGGSDDAIPADTFGMDVQEDAMSITADELPFRYTQKQFENAPVRSAEVTLEQGSAVLGDIRVEIPFWELEDEGDRIEVRDLPELSQGEEGWSIRAYDFSLASGTHEFDSDIRLTIPREGIAGFSGCVWYNEDLGRWEDIYSEVSDDGKYYTIYTDHFSLFGEKKYRFDEKRLDLILDDGKRIDLKHGIFIECPVGGQNRMEAEVMVDYERMWNMYQNKNLENVQDLGNSIARFTADPKEYEQLTDGGWMPRLDIVGDVLGMVEAKDDIEGVADAMMGKESPNSVLGDTMTFVDILLTSYRVYAEIKSGMKFNSYTTALGETLKNHAFDIAGNTVGFAGFFATTAWNPVIALAGLIIYGASQAYQLYYVDGIEEWNTKYYPDEGEVFRRFYEDAGVRLFFDSAEIRKTAAQDYHYAVMDKPANMDTREFNELRKLVNEQLKGIRTNSYRGFAAVFNKLIEMYAGDPVMLETVLDDFYHSVAWAIWKLPKYSEGKEYTQGPEYDFLKKYKGLGKDPYALKRSEQLKLSEMYVMKIKVDTTQILENVVGRLQRRACGELIRKMDKEFLPVLNRKLVFRVIDGALAPNQRFSDSVYCVDWQTINSNRKYRSLPDADGSVFDEGFTAPIRFENVKGPVFLPLDYDGSVLSEHNYYPYTSNFIPRPEKNTNIVFRCTYFHYLMMGAPKRMIFRDIKSGKEVKADIVLPKIDPKELTRGTDVYVTVNGKKLEVPAISATLYYSEMKGTGRSAKDRSPESGVTVTPSGEVTISLAALNNHRITYATGARAEKDYEIYNRPGMTLHGKVDRFEPNGQAYTSDISVGKIGGSGGFSKVKEPEKLIIMTGYLTGNPGGFEDRYTRYDGGKMYYETLYKVKKVGIAPAGYKATGLDHGGYSTFIIWQSKETGAVGAAIRFRGDMSVQYDGGENKKADLRTIILSAADPCDSPDLLGW